MKSCETCTAFHTAAQRSPADTNDALAGECRAQSPRILATYNTAQGPSWTAGWPPVMSTGWCRQHQARMSMARNPLLPGGRTDGGAA